MDVEGKEPTVNADPQGVRRRPPFVAFPSPFLRRTVLAILATLGMVASVSAVYFDPGWAMIYLISGSWALLSFGLTPFLFKYLLFEKRIVPGLALIFFKLALVAALIGLLALWSRSGMNGARMAGALVAGITTPLAVVTLRAVGSLCGRSPLVKSDQASQARSTAGSH
jgi:hypothetical protein